MADDASAVEPGAERQRQWWLLLPAVLIAAVGMKLYFDLSQVPKTNAVVTLTAAPEPAASAPSSVEPLASGTVEGLWGHPSLAAERVGRAASAALATARAAAGLTPQPPAEVVMDLCGVGRLTVPRPELMDPDKENVTNFETLPAPLGLWARTEAWPRVLAAMEEAAQPERTRAAAQVLRASGMLFAEFRLGTQPALPVSEIAQATRSLARLARRTSDATVLSWALAMCEREQQPSVDCKRLSPRELSRLAPDEAQSWLALAFMPGISAAQRDAAMDKAAQAERLGGQSYQLTQAVDSVWPGDVPEYLRLDLLIQALAVDGAMAPQWLYPIARLCNQQALSDPQRALQCEAIARKLQTNETSLQALVFAAGLGKRLGWSEAELATMQAEHISLASRPIAMLDEQPYACQAVATTRQWLADAASQGEVRAMRQRAAASPQVTPRPATGK